MYFGKKGIIAYERAGRSKEGNDKSNWRILELGRSKMMRERERTSLQRCPIFHEADRSRGVTTSNEVEGFSYQRPT